MTAQEKNYIILLSLAIGSQTALPQTPDYPKLLEIAQAHGTANLLCYGVGKLPQELQPKPAMRGVLKQIAYTGAIRETMQAQELTALFQAFPEAKLRVLPLKGCLIKHLYPKPEMRHMSDVDLLIDPAEAARVRELLEGIGWKCDKFDVGDTDLYTSPSGFCYEVHRSLENEGGWTETRTFCAALLEYAAGEYVRELSPEQHFAYLLCHFVKHLINGGIGVRQVMDLFLCRRTVDPAKLEALLTELKLAEFDRTAEALGRYWFEAAPPVGAAAELGDYVLGSGVFGTEEQRVTDWMLQEQDSKSSYLVRRLFPPMKLMRGYFPVLKRWPVLLPAFWIYRILRAVFARRGKLRTEVDTLRRTDADEVQARAAFYGRCGLRIYDEK